MKSITYFLLIICALTLFGCTQKQTQDAGTNQNQIINSGENQQIQTGVEETETNTTTGSTSTGELNNDTQATATITQIKGNGTEPFWTFDLSGTQLTREEPNMESGGIVTNIYNFVDLLSQSGNTAIYSNSGTVLLNIIYGSCNNGMSETVYTGNVVATISGIVYTGCVDHY